MNKIELMGRLTKDVEIKKSKAGNDWAVFTLAVARDKETTDFIDCLGFGKMAETLVKYVEKGNRIIVCGSLQINSYTNKEGQNVAKPQVIVNDFYFVDFKKDLVKDNK